MSLKTAPLSIAIRDMSHGDLKAVVAIDQQTEHPWDADAIYRMAAKPRGQVVVAVTGKHMIAGFAIIEKNETQCFLLHLVVHKQFQRRGVGRRLIAWLCDTISNTPRNHILTNARDTNLGAQMFYKSCGFIATNVFREFYEDTGEDMIRFEKYRRPKTVKNGAIQFSAE